MSDPFIFYYAVYLPNQQLQAMRPNPMDTINSAIAGPAILRPDGSDGTSYNPISPYSEGNYDPLRPYSQQNTRAPCSTLSVRSERSNTRRSGPSLYYNRAAAYFPGLRPGVGPNANVYRGRGSGRRSGRIGGGGGWAGWHGWNGRNGRWHGWHGWHGNDVSSETHPPVVIPDGARPEQLRLSSDERADLVAYLDGELPEAHSRVISTKLTQSATARREVEMLKKTWELLDFLPLPQAPPEFSERTVSHIHRLELEGHRGSRFVALVRASGSGRRLCHRRGAVVGLGYALTRWAWPDPTERWSAT